MLSEQAEVAIFIFYLLLKEAKGRVLDALDGGQFGAISHFENGLDGDGALDFVVDTDIFGTGAERYIPLNRCGAGKNIYGSRCAFGPVAGNIRRGIGNTENACKIGKLELNVFFIIP